MLHSSFRVSLPSYVWNLRCEFVYSLALRVQREEIVLTLVAFASLVIPGVPANQEKLWREEKY